MKSKFSFIFIVIILFSFSACAFDLGVSPPRIEMKEGDCREIFVFSEDYKGIISIRDTLQSNINYGEEFYLDGEKRILVCLNESIAERGFLYFKTKDANVEVGILISVLAQEAKFDINKITGAFSGLMDFGLGNALLVESLFLLAILVAFWFVLRRRRKSK